MGKVDCNLEAQAVRREGYWARIGEKCRQFFNDRGEFNGNGWREGSARAYDQRNVIELSTALLHGDAGGRELAEKALRANDLMLGHCAFAMDMMMALWHSSGHYLTPSTREWLLGEIRAASVTTVNGTLHRGVGAAGYDVTHSGHNLRGVQWHGYNDNHVSLATSALILTGELLNEPHDVEAGRASLYQLRDVLQRRGFIHEANDCYLPHTMYPLAAIVAWARDAECRELAQGALDRIWSDLIGHWHPNLARKIGPSARDYTHGRLSCQGWGMLFSYVFGEGALPGWLCIDDILEPEQTPEHRRVAWPHGENLAWSLGFLTRVSAQPYHVPEFLAGQVVTKPYPYEIVGTNEFGNMLEIWEEVHPDGSKTQHGLHNVQYAGGEHLLTSYMEADWGMGTADQRLLGSCPNNNWQVSYRKRAPLDDARDQGSWYCSFSINHKCMAEEHHLQMIEGRPESRMLHGPIHFGDAGRFAGVQHRGTAIMLYRPRPLENWAIRSLALTLLYPLHYGNQLDQLWFGEQRIEEWQGESATVSDIFVQDGPIYLGFRPLLPPWREDLDGLPLPTSVRLRAARRGLWGCVDIVGYEGEPIAVQQECDLARLGNGFLVEVATEADFASLEDFKAWFRRGKLVDDTFHWQRQVRYCREGLELGLRWDAWQDRIVSRSLNGRALPIPQFACTGIDNERLPWLSGPVATAPATDWLPVLVNRPQHSHGHQPLPLNIEPGVSS